MIAMGPQEDYIETVVTCEGDFHDPELHSRLEKFRLNLKELLSTDSNKVILKKVEPWNSVRVTFNITKEAALRLKQLAEQGNAALRSLGVLAVQIEGDQIISLTIAGRNNERAEVILKTNDNSRPGLSSASVFDSGLHSSDEIASPGPSSVETTRKNIADYLKKGTLFDTFFNPNQSVHGNEVFRSPNVVATSCEPIPFKANNILNTSHSPFHGTTTTQSSSNAINFPPGRSPTGYPATHSPNFPSPSSSSRSPVGQPALKFPSPPGVPLTGVSHTPPPHSFPNLPPPPPYPHTMAPVNNVPRQGKTVTAASPLLVNLLQTEPLVAGLSNIPGQKMLPPNEGGPPLKKKRRPRKPKDNSKQGHSVDGEIPIESIPNPALEATSSIAMTESAVSTCQSVAIPKMPYLTHQTSIANHTQGVKDSVMCGSTTTDSDNVISSGTHKLSVEDPFPPEVTAGKIVNPYTGKLEPIDKISDLSPNKTKPVGRSIDGPIISEKVSTSVHVSDNSLSGSVVRAGLPVVQEDKVDSVAATRISSLTTQSISPVPNNNRVTNTIKSVYMDNDLSTVKPVNTDIYASESSSQRVNSTVNVTADGPTSKQENCGLTSVKLESVAYSETASLPKLANSLAKSSVMHSISATFCSGTGTSQPNKPHNALPASSQPSSGMIMSSSFSSQDTTSVIYSQTIQSHAKLETLSSLNSPNVRNTEVHSVTGSPNGKVSCEGDDGSNHSGIINDITPEGVTATVSPLDSSGNKAYNHDSGVGSSSERSDDTPSEHGDEFRTSTQVHVEVSGEECLKALKYSAECKNSKVMTVGYVMNHEQPSSAPHSLANSISHKETLSKTAHLKEFDQYLYGSKQNDITAVENQSLLVTRTDKEHFNFNHTEKKLTNGPSTLIEQNSIAEGKAEESINAKSPGFLASLHGAGSGDATTPENGPSRSKNLEKKKGMTTPNRQPSKEAESTRNDQQLSGHYNNYTPDWPDLSTSLFGMGQINTDNFDSSQFDGIDFDSPPNSEKFAGFTEQDILQATAKGLACKGLDVAKGSNITSKYSKRSSPVNVNMLNHLYAPGLPLPRRLTESVQRLVKPLPSNDHSLPHSRACKSPGNSKNSNGSASPRSGPGGARSPGANTSRSGNGVGVAHSVNSFSGPNSAMLQQTMVSGNLTNNNQLLQQTAMSCGNNSLSLPTSTDSQYRGAGGDGTNHAYNVTSCTTSLQDNCYQYHSNMGSSLTTSDAQPVAKEQIEQPQLSPSTTTTTSKDRISPSQLETVPSTSSVCNISVGNDIGSGLSVRQDVPTDDQSSNTTISANSCAMEQTKLNDLNKSASEKSSDSTTNEHTLSFEIKTVVVDGDALQPSADTSNVNKLVGENESRSDGVSVPPFVSSSLQHSTSNLSGSALTTQTSVSYSRQHGVSLSSIDIAKTVPFSPVDNSTPNVQSSQMSESSVANSVKVEATFQQTEAKPSCESDTKISVNSSSTVTDLCSPQISKNHCTSVSVHSSPSTTTVTSALPSDTLLHPSTNTPGATTAGEYHSTTSESSGVIVNHVDSKSQPSSDQSLSTSTAVVTSTSQEAKPLEASPPNTVHNEITSVANMEGETPLRRQTRKRKSANSESDGSEAKEAKLEDTASKREGESEIFQLHNSVMVSSHANATGEGGEPVKLHENKVVNCEEKSLHVDEDKSVHDEVGLGKEEDLLTKRGRRNKPLATAPVLGYSFFDAPVMQGRTRSQSSTPANEKSDQKEDIPLTTPKRSTRSVKQKDQTEIPTNKRRRSRDHR